MLPFRVRGRKWRSGRGGGQGWGWSLQSDAAGMAGQGRGDGLRPRHQPTEVGVGEPVAKAWPMAVGALPMAKGPTHSPEGPRG